MPYGPQKHTCGDTYCVLRQITFKCRKLPEGALIYVTLSNLDRFTIVYLLSLNVYNDKGFP